MIWNKHLNLKNTHAMFGASQSAWLRYDENKMIESLNSRYRKDLGTEIHEFAASQIILKHRFTSIKNLKENLETYIYKKYFKDELDDIQPFGLKMIKSLKYLPKETLETVKNYINDGIAYRMNVEQPLYYSEYFYGTADTIRFSDNFLRIHDLKSGSTSVHIEQLFIYAALFCLEYNIKPVDIQIEVRIYQNGEVLYHNPEPEVIMDIINKITYDNKMIVNLLKEE